MTDVDVDDALRYPFRGGDALKRFAIGGGVPSALNVGWLVVGLFSIVVPVLAVLYLPLFAAQLAIGIVLTGYFLRVAAHTFEGGSDPPAFDDWGGLVREGLYGFLVVLAYQVPLVVVAGVGLGFAFLSVAGAGAVADGSSAAGGALGVVGLVVLLVVMLVGTVLSLAMGYLAPISLVSYAEAGELGAAFDVDRVKPVALSAQYAIPWLLAGGMYVAAASVVSFLTAILVGYLLVPLLPLVYFYVGTVGMYMFAQAYANVHEVSVPTPAEPEATPTAESDSRRLEDL
jgi:hypothetical protein